MATTQLTVESGLALSRAEQITLQLIPTNSVERQVVLNRRLDTQVIPRVEEALEALQAGHADDSAAEPASAARLQEGWQAWLRLRHSGQLDLLGSDAEMAAVNDRLAQEVADIFTSIGDTIDEAVREEALQARAAGDAAEQSYRTMRQIALVVAVSLAGGGGVVFWLVRSIVPRVRATPRSRPRSPRASRSPLSPLTGGDELTDLGRALNDLVVRQQEVRSFQAEQAELATRCKSPPARARRTTCYAATSNVRSPPLKSPC